MSVIRVPIMIVRHDRNRYSGYLLQTRNTAPAYAENKKKVKHQLQETARYRVANDETLDTLEEPALVLESLLLQPAYPHEGMTFPSAETIRLQIYVLRAVVYDTPTALVPALNLCFYYNNDSDYRATLTREVQAKVRDMDPGAMSRLFVPGEVELDKILVHPAKEKEQQDFTEPATLALVASHLESRDVKRAFGNAWCRDETIQQLSLRLGRSERGLLLLGPSGCGKTTVLVQAARRIKREEPKPRDTTQAPRFWMTRPGRILAGMNYLGEWQERAEQLIEDIQALDGVLCFDDLTDLIQLGASHPSESIAAFLLPFIKQGLLRVVVEATPDQLQTCRRLLPEFTDAFDILVLPDLSAANRAEILTKAVQIEAGRRNQEAVPVVDQVVGDLFARFKPYHPFPAEPVQFIAELYEAKARQGKTTVTGNDAVAHFIHKTGLPPLLIDAEQTLAWETVRDRLHQKVVAQDAACERVADVITTFKAGLNDPERPLGVFLFSGPTGVGKTECAKATADYLFGHGEDKNKRLVRLDMSEYAYPGSSQRLLVKDDGLPADWLGQVRNTPFCVVLLDEIEKAAADVFDLLLGLLDEGRLRDHYGRISHFNSTVIIMTSNLGTERTAPVGYGEGNAASFLKTAMTFFRPEFVNRLDHIVAFRALDSTAIQKIAAMNLAKIPEREGFRERKLSLTWNDAVVAFLAARGYEPRYGARPLKRVIEQQVITPIARLLVEQPELADRRLRLDLVDNNIQVSVGEATAG
ncbi:AAA family ATPase [Acanthopleuribacter pedis]|uniref:ATP-dependent Clp protease ATP-binding subunit n=1 Tax=Acanthopleuribacter pedis TaxID=442870 RepID=A0A8J7QF02_9BACT|nr:AAA family ATPase [Acanthopleuribacter pedis]MBO1317268.1 ATP-dependent Clp protease ATP-binding subunit [Acanthopleuribacter pedis]MBO1318575.1 ATP-dependent Clp protease ATP-binding subunit [Acanthopleuribacter pedis]